MPGSGKVRKNYVLPGGKTSMVGRSGAEKCFGKAYMASLYGFVKWICEIFFLCDHCRLQESFRDHCNRFAALWGPLPRTAESSYLNDCACTGNI